MDLGDLTFLPNLEQYPMNWDNLPELMQGYNLSDFNYYSSFAIADYLNPQLKPNLTIDRNNRNRSTLRSRSFIL
jgi:hypothetical protein